MDNFIDESQIKQDNLDLISFIIPNLTFQKSRPAFKNDNKDNNLYFVNNEGVKYFQYNVITQELGLLHEILDDVKKYMPNTDVSFFELIPEWFSEKYNLPVKGIPFKIKKSFII